MVTGTFILDTMSKAATIATDFIVILTLILATTFRVDFLYSIMINIVDKNYWTGVYFVHAATINYLTATAVATIHFINFITLMVNLYKPPIQVQITPFRCIKASSWIQNLNPIDYEQISIFLAYSYVKSVNDSYYSSTKMPMALATIASTTTIYGINLYLLLVSKII